MAYHKKSNVFVYKFYKLAEMAMRWVCHLIDHHFSLKQLLNGLWVSQK